jgi:F-type H+-transporting ATPase subunit a
MEISPDNIVIYAQESIVINATLLFTWLTMGLLVQDPEPYLSFVGTLFLFIVTSNLLTVVPGYHAPTGSLSTTVALALCVFVAVPIFGIRQQGFGEFSRTLALAMRLFGDIMSGNLLGAILLSLVPLFVPIVMHVLGLVFGVIQAYVFSVLALVYIASATSVQQQNHPVSTQENTYK